MEGTASNTHEQVNEIYGFKVKQLNSFTEIPLIRVSERTLMISMTIKIIPRYGTEDSISLTTAE